MTRRTALLTFVVLVIPVVVIGMFLTGRSDRTHDAPLDIAAPPVVAAALADQTARLPESELIVQPVSDLDEAMGRLESGRSVGVVLVDLTADADTLIVSSDNSDALNAAVSNHARTFSAGLGRTMQVEQRDTAAPDHRWGYLVVALSLIAGFAIAAMLVWKRGEPASLAAARARMGRLIAVSATVGVGAAIVALLTNQSWRWALVVAALVSVSATFTHAFEAWLGIIGLAAASAICVVSSILLLTFTSPYQLGGLFGTIERWLPSGAGLRLAAASGSGDSGELRDWATLAIYLGLAFLTIVVARRAADRQRAMS